LLKTNERFVCEQSPINCACDKRICQSCNYAHLPLTCNLYLKWKILYEEESKRVLVDEGSDFNKIVRATKECTRCHKMVVRDGGCPHMTCVCKHEFCWICTKPWRGNHDCTGDPQLEIRQEFFKEFRDQQVKIQTENKTFKDTYFIFNNLKNNKSETENRSRAYNVLQIARLFLANLHVLSYFIEERLGEKITKDLEHPAWYIWLLNAKIQGLSSLLLRSKSSFTDYGSKEILELIRCIEEKSIKLIVSYELDKEEENVEHIV